MKPAEMRKFFKKNTLRTEQGSFPTELSFIIVENEEFSVEMYPGIIGDNGKKQYLQASIFLHARWFTKHLALLDPSVDKPDWPPTFLGNGILVPRSLSKYRRDKGEGLEEPHLVYFLERLGAWFDLVSQPAMQATGLWHYHDIKGINPEHICHILARAMRGDVETIQAYQEGAARGEMTFCPNVTEEVFERAIALAHEYGRGERVPPVPYTEENHTNITTRTPFYDFSGFEV